MGAFNRIGTSCKECCPDCPRCPGVNTNRRGWTTRPINGCQPCGDCPTCSDYPNRVGFTETTGDPSRCPRCPQCKDDGCHISKTAGQKCNCIPTRLLCVFVGAGANCDCFVNGCPPIQPTPHTESSGSLGSYCSTDVGLDAIPLMLRTWGNDGTDCGPPASLIYETLIGFVSFGAFFGVAAVECQVNAGMGGSTVFSGHVTGLPCAGPWIVPNDAVGCYVCQPGCDCMVTSTGGFAIIYPCGC